MFSLPVCMGMASLALDLPVSNDEALQGLVLPAAAFVILGKAGGWPPLRLSLGVAGSCEM